LRQWRMRDKNFDQEQLFLHCSYLSCVGHTGAGASFPASFCGRLSPPRCQEPSPCFQLPQKNFRIPASTLLSRRPIPRLRDCQGCTLFSFIQSCGDLPGSVNMAAERPHSDGVST
jgi:hypothetical protein